MSGTDYLLDTNVVIGFLGGRREIVSCIDRILATGDVLMVSQITRMELLGFPDIADNETKAIEELLSCLKVLSLNRSIENRVIRIRKTHRIKLPDAIIVSTAIEYNCKLLSCDRKIAGLGIVNLDVQNPCDGA